MVRLRNQRRPEQGRCTADSEWGDARYCGRIDAEERSHQKGSGLAEGVLRNDKGRGIPSVDGKLVIGCGDKEDDAGDEKCGAEPLPGHSE
jgi:hypothetical protein